MTSLPTTCVVPSGFYKFPIPLRIKVSMHTHTHTQTTFPSMDLVSIDILIWHTTCMRVEWASPFSVPVLLGCGDSLGFLTGRLLPPSLLS